MWDVRGACAVFNKILKWVAASLKRSEFGQFSEFVFSGPHQKVENLVQNAKILVIFPRYFIKNIAGDRRVQMFLITRYQRYLAGKLLKLFLRHLLNSAKLSWPLKRSSTSAHVGPSLRAPSCVCGRERGSRRRAGARAPAPGPGRRWGCSSPRCVASALRQNAAYRSGPSVRGESCRSRHGSGSRVAGPGGRRRGRGRAARLPAPQRRVCAATTHIDRVRTV